MAFDGFCMSSFLTFRYVVRKEAAWMPGFAPVWPQPSSPDPIGVSHAAELLDALRHLVSQVTRRSQLGIFLSGGIDSALLAALLPEGTPAYTIRFAAEGAVDESPMAAVYAERCGLPHRIITVTWADYEQTMDVLMRHKRSPLHPVEVGLFRAASEAARDGLRTIMIGNGADSTFGGMDQLLARDWTTDEFVRRYTFLDPASAIKEPVSMRPVYEAYGATQRFDVRGFLKEVHGRGIAQAFDNAIQAAGCQSVEPYEALTLTAPLDLARIRRGESKYLLRELFRQFYPDLEVPEKIPFARPMDQWLQAWSGPQRREFVEASVRPSYSGEQKWLLYSLERFMNLVNN